MLQTYQPNSDEQRPVPLQVPYKDEEGDVHEDKFPPNEGLNPRMPTKL